MCELVSEEMVLKLPKLYECENIPIKDKMLMVRYYATNSSWEWYLNEYDNESKIAFGYVKGFEKEWGYFSISEFEEINSDKSSMMKIIRDEEFEPIRFKELDVD